MVRLACRCLNVKIHVKNSSTELSPVDPNIVGINSEVYTIEDFFTSEVCLVQPDLEGVTKEYDCLTREKTIGDWTLSKCLNCQTKTHAIHLHQGDNRVLVNSKLRLNTDVIESIKSSSEYSPLYKILIPGRNDNETHGPTLRRFEAMHQESLMLIQQQLNTYLMAEEALMEERIRLYEEKQRAAFRDLQRKARQDKSKLVSIALSVEGDVVTDSLSEAMTESPISPLSTGSQDISSSSKGSEKGNSNFLMGSSEQKSFGTVLNLTRRPNPPVTHTPKSPEADGMFDMEGFDDIQEPDVGSNYESDDDDNDTDDSSYSSDASMRESLRGSGSSRSGLYSTSVPMNVPMWSRSNRYHTDSPNERDGPGDIGASIKALAQSVRVDGTEIFGDLPRGSNKQFRTAEIMKRREKCHFKDDPSDP